MNWAGWVDAKAQELNGHWLWEVPTFFRRVVVQVLAKPSLDLRDAHFLAFVIISHLIAADLAKAERSGLRMSEVEPTQAGAGPHRIRLSKQHSGVRLHIEQAPERALFFVVRVASRRPNPAILFVDQVLFTQTLPAAVTPLLSHTLVRAFGKKLQPDDCCRATLGASSYLPALISVANLGEPATLVHSPIMMKTLGCWVNGCDPERRSGFVSIASWTLMLSTTLTH